MDVRRPKWWSYPVECANGHAWGPGRVIVSWRPCQCEPARMAQRRGSGHRTVRCRVPGCESIYYEPPHDEAHVEHRPLTRRVALSHSRGRVAYWPEYQRLAA